MKRRLFCVPFHRFRGDNFQHKMSTHHLLDRKTVLPFEIPHQSSSSRSRHDEFSCWVTTQNIHRQTLQVSIEVTRCDVTWLAVSSSDDAILSADRNSKPNVRTISGTGNHLLEKLFKIRYPCTNVKFIFGLISKFHLTLTVLRFSSF